MNTFAVIARLFRPAAPKTGRLIEGRFKVRDISIPYRLPAGFAGDVNRTHPVNIEPCIVDQANPPLYAGQAVVIDPTTSGVRPLILGDPGTTIYGLTVRSFPLQQPTGGMGATIGVALYKTTGVADVMLNGYMLVAVSGTAQPAKGLPVYVWTAASTGTHVLGGLEAAASAGNTALLSGARWNGTLDPSGVAEVVLTF